MIILLNTFICRKWVNSNQGFLPTEPLTYNINISPQNFPFKFSDLIKYAIIQHWYRDENEHSISLVFDDETDNKFEFGKYIVPPIQDNAYVYRGQGILPTIEVSEPCTVWIRTYCDDDKVQDYPLIFQHKANHRA